MTLPVVLTTAAEADIEVARSFLESQRPQSAQKFLTKLELMLERIEAMPRMYGVVRRDVRAARVNPFLYVVYYRILSDRVEVFAVLHGHRSGSAWRTRLS